MSKEETTLGMRLRLLIRESGLEQQEVAARLDLKTPTFSGYVIDKREPAFAKLKKFADYFGVSIDFLLGYSEIRDPYLRHLPDELQAFVRDPDNVRYLELAREMKGKARSVTVEKQSASEKQIQTS